MLTHRCFIFVLAAPAILLCVAAKLLGQTMDEPNRVHVSDVLEKRATLVGQLGKPVGEAVRVVGHWRVAKGFKAIARPQFVVTQVNGAALRQPARFDQNFVYARDSTTRGLELERRDGDVWHMVAYEGLRVSGEQALNEALGNPLSQDPFEGVHSVLTGVVTRVE